MPESRGSKLQGIQQKRNKRSADIPCQQLLSGSGFDPQSQQPLCVRGCDIAPAGEVRQRVNELGEVDLLRNFWEEQNQMMALGA